MFVSSKWLARRPTRHFRGGYELIFLSFSFFYIIVRILAEPRGICQINRFLFSHVRSFLSAVFRSMGHGYRRLRDGSIRRSSADRKIYFSLSFLDNQSMYVRFQRRVAYCYIRIAWHRVVSRVRDLDCKTLQSHLIWHIYSIRFKAYIYQQNRYTSKQFKTSNIRLVQEIWCM